MSESLHKVLLHYDFQLQLKQKVVVKLPSTKHGDINHNTTSNIHHELWIACCLYFSAIAIAINIICFCDF